MALLDIDLDVTKDDGVGWDIWNSLYCQKVEEQLGLGPDELPDIYSEADAFDNGLSVRDAVRECIEAQCEEAGFDPDDFLTI